MSKYTVEVNRHYTYEVTIEAEDEFEAVELVRDYEIEDLEPHEVDAYFNFDVVGYPND